MPFQATKNNDPQSVCYKLTSMSTADTNSDATRHTFESAEETRAASGAASDHVRDIAEVPAVEVITTSAVHLMSAAAVKCGLAEGTDAETYKDLDEARKLITALAGFITAAAPEIGSQHAGPLRDGLAGLWVTSGGRNMDILLALHLPDWAGLAFGAAMDID